MTRWLASILLVSTLWLTFLQIWFAFYGPFWMYFLMFVAMIVSFGLYCYVDSKLERPLISLKKEWMVDR